MILVTTAGKVGSEAAYRLADRGVPVRVLVRNRAKASALEDAGVDVVEGDLEVASTVDAAMREVSGIVLVSPALPAQELTVVASAVSAGVDHVVKITSESSLDSSISRRRNQAQIEDALIASGLGYTLLKNNAYMQNFLMLAPAIAATNRFGSSTGDGKIGMIDTRDVGAVAAKIALAPDAHRGATYWPTGPEQLSYADAAAILSARLGREITFTAMTFNEQKQAMIAAGLPESVAQDNATALQLFADGEAAYVTDDVPRILGRPARTFDTFVADYAAAFDPPR